MIGSFSISTSLWRHLSTLADTLQTCPGGMKPGLAGKTIHACGHFLLTRSLSLSPLITSPRYRSLSPMTDSFLRRRRRLGRDFLEPRRDSSHVRRRTLWRRRLHYSGATMQSWILRSPVHRIWLIVSNCVTELVSLSIVLCGALFCGVQILF